MKRYAMDYARYGKDEAYTRGVQEAIMDYLTVGRKPTAKHKMYACVVMRADEAPWERAFAEGYLAYRMPALEAAETVRGEE